MSCSLHFPFPPARPRPCGRHPWASVPTRLSAYGYCWEQVQGHAASWRLAFAETARPGKARSEEHTSELQSLAYLVCRLLLEKKKKQHHVSVLDGGCGDCTGVRS